MKKIIAKLQEICDELNAEVEKRNDTYESRTEKWQESEKGEAYQEGTDMIEEYASELSDWISNLEDMKP